jgi:hypothetical protein
MPPAGFYGNAGRNVIIGPGLQVLDIGLRKDVGLGGSSERRLELRVDLFNVLNRANFGTPDGQVFNAATRQRIASAGLITTTVTSARQMQLGVRLAF